MTSEEIPGPTWHEGISHGLDYDHESFTVHIIAVIVMPQGKVRLRSTTRPMTEDEVIFSKTRGHSREAVLKAYGVVETPPTDPQPGSWLTSLLLKLKVVNRKRRSTDD